MSQEIIIPVKQAKLIPEEATHLANCEAIIKAGKITFLAVGIALTEIRDKHLYRTEFKNFAEYLWKRWGISRSHGYRIITAAHLRGRLNNLSPGGDIRLPSEERAVRALLQVSGEEKQMEVLQRAAELAGDDDILTKHVRAALQDLGCASNSSSRERRTQTTKREAATLLQNLSQAVEAGADKQMLLILVQDLSNLLKEKRFR